MACYQRKHPGNIFLLGYQRDKFIGCWTLGTRKLAKKIQKRWLEVRFRLQRLGARNLKL